MAFPIVNGKTQGHGFTLIELLVVLAIIATLISVAAPQYFGASDRAKDTVLREDLNVMRDCIDKYYGDTGKYPESLQILVEKRYLRAVPVDPITERKDTWIEIRSAGTGSSGITDVKSGAPGNALDGTPYKDF